MPPGIALIAAGLPAAGALCLLLAAGCRTVDCTRVDCYRPVACCAGTCQDGFLVEPPPARSLEDCCTCRGRASADECPPSTRCFRQWQHASAGP